MKIKINIIPTIKIFDVVEFDNGESEWTFLFIKLYLGKNITRYYLDTVGFGLDVSKTRTKKLISFNLLFFIFQIGIESKSHLRVVNG